MNRIRREGNETPDLLDVPLPLEHKGTLLEAKNDAYVAQASAKTNFTGAYPAMLARMRPDSCTSIRILEVDTSGVPSRQGVPGGRSGPPRD